MNVPKSGKALDAVNSMRAMNGLPRFVLKPTPTRLTASANKPKRSVGMVVELRPIATTEDELLDLAVNHHGTVTGLVTAEVAAWLLALNTGNRNIMPENVARFRRMLQEGRWQNTGEPIIVSQEGILNDGQHRLIAIKAAAPASDAIRRTYYAAFNKITADQLSGVRSTQSSYFSKAL